MKLYMRTECPECESTIWIEVDDLHVISGDTLETTVSTKGVCENCEAEVTEEQTFW